MSLDSNCFYNQSSKVRNHSQKFLLASRFKKKTHAFKSIFGLGLVFILFDVCERFSCICVCAPHVCLIPVAVRGGCQV